MKISTSKSLLILSVLLLIGCKKKIINSPMYPPSGQYFAVDDTRLLSLNENKILIERVNDAGEVITSKAVKEKINLNNRSGFRLAESWNDQIELYVDGVNKFQFRYSDSIVDHVEVDISINTLKNVIIFNEVKVNGELINPIVQNSPASNSKIYLIN